MRSKFVKKYFNNTASRIEGVGLYVLKKKFLVDSKKLLNLRVDINEVDYGGDYKWRRNGEAHMLNPLTISKLQQSVRQESYSIYKIYSDNINKQNEQFMTLRGLIKFV